MRNRNEDYYRFPALLERACKETGYNYRKQNRDGEDLHRLRMHSAGYKLGLDSLHVRRLKRSALFRRISHYLRRGSYPFSKRFRRAAFLYLILALPAVVFRLLLQLQDIWSFSSSRQQVRSLV